MRRTPVVDAVTAVRASDFLNSIGVCTHNAVPIEGSAIVPY